MKPFKLRLSLIILMLTLLVSLPAAGIESVELEGLIEPYMELEKDLASEMRVLNSRWKKRRQLLDRAMLSTTGLYGDLQGIIGGSLQEIEAMDMLALEASVEDTSE